MDNIHLNYIHSIDMDESGNFSSSSYPDILRQTPLDEKTWNKLLNDCTNVFSPKDTPVKEKKKPSALSGICGVLSLFLGMLMVFFGCTFAVFLLFGPIMIMSGETQKGFRSSKSGMSELTIIGIGFTSVGAGSLLLGCVGVVLFVVGGYKVLKLLIGGVLNRAHGDTTLLGKASNFVNNTSYIYLQQSTPFYLRSTPKIYQNGSKPIKRMSLHIGAFSTPPPHIHNQIQSPPPNYFSPPAFPSSANYP